MNNKWLLGLHDWMRLNILLLACMVMMRPLFFLEVYFRIGLEPRGFLTILSGAIFDLLLVARCFTYGLIPFLLIYRFFPKTAHGVVVGLIVAYVVVSALLFEYYCNLTMPLDHVILVYTPEELKTTVFSSASLSFAQVFWFVVMVAVPVLLIWLWRKVHFKTWMVVTVGVLFLLATVFVRYPKLIRKESLYASHLDFCLAVNQPTYSYVKITDFIKESKQRALAEGSNNEVLQDAVKAYHVNHPEFIFDHPGYPFYRQFTDPDVLGPFFNATSDGLPPNIVFILVEGLGRRLTGVTDPQISFTPFIDSLAAEGLFWPNCFSTTERTFGVLSGVFASPPHGRFGFSTPKAPTPRHHSLLFDLNQNGYTTSFYYGGDMSFDGYGFFMQSNHVDNLFSPQLVVEDSTHYQLLADNNRWGADDDQLFKYAVAQHKADTAVHRPYTDVYLTLSTHEPFIVEDIEKYQAQVKRMLEQHPKMSDAERNNIVKNTNIYGCYLYTDHSIKELFAYYASRPDFNNTIFVITGDHRMALVSAGMGLRKYNVPLVIYSPLLKRHKTMHAVTSHIDIAPSFDAYLSSNYDYTTSDHCHWLGTSFDTLAGYRNLKKLAFMLNNRDVVEYINGDEMISSGKLTLLDSLFVGAPGNDEAHRQKLEEELESYRLLSEYVVQNDMLLPPNSDNIIFNDTHYDFDKNTSEVYEKYVVKADDGSKYLHIDKSVEFFRLCSQAAVRPVYENILIEISFDVKSVDTISQLPLLVVSFGTDWHSHNLESVVGEPLNTGNWEHYHARMITNAIHKETPEALKIYLWNNNKVEYDLDNLVVTVEGEPRK